jgi:peptide/nickel transport system ATP-binding protein
VSERPGNAEVVRALLSAVLVPDPEAHRPPVEIREGTPSAVNPPPRCRFLDRCPIAGSVCHENDHPPLTDRGGGHWVACYRV